jgi:hypothetical protein
MPSAVRNEVEHSARAIVPGQCVRVGDTRRVSVPGSEAPSQPQVKLVRSGDVIQAIEITCTCGQQIRLKCSY